MKRRFRLPLVLILCAAAGAPGAIVPLVGAAASVRTEDHNRDGRPDVWHVYDCQHQLSEVAVDTNFDGRSDVLEYYERGALVRRESDRDFNDRVDLVEEFDPATREHVRSVVDVDYNGRADLLVLFQGGRPVFSRRIHLAAPAAVNNFSALHAAAPIRSSNDPLAPLEDPFETDLALRSVRVATSAGACVGLSTSGGLPASCTDVVGPLASLSDVSASIPQPSSATVVPYSPRGPPVSSLLTFI